MKVVYGIQVAYHFIPFIIQNRYSVVWPRIVSFFQALRVAEPDTSVGAAGFCWGGKYAMLLAKHHHHHDVEGASLVDAAFAAHPSFVKLPDDVQGLEQPLSIAIGTKDLVMNVAMVEKLKGLLGKETGAASEVVVFEDAKHGAWALGILPCGYPVTELICRLCCSRGPW